MESAKADSRGRISCHNCKEEKNTEQLRWCMTCSCSICNECLIDKHAKTHDAATVPQHSVCEWNLDYPAVRFCLEQLNLEATKVEQTARSTKANICQYVDGFRQFLLNEIEYKCNEKLTALRVQMEQLTNSFGIDPKTIVTTNQAKPFLHLLPELRRLGGHTAEHPVALCCPTDQLFQFTNPSYDDVAERFVSPSNQQTYLSDRTKLDADYWRRKFTAKATVIGDEVPCWTSICPMTSGDQSMVLIVYMDRGPCLFNVTTGQLTGPYNLCSEKYKYFESVAPFPSLSQGDTVGGSQEQEPHVRKFLMTCIKMSSKKEKPVCVLLAVDTEKQTVEHVQLKGEWHLEIPVHSDVVLHASSRWLFLQMAKNQNLWRFDPTGPNDWVQIYTSKYIDNQYYHIGSAIDEENATIITMTNTVWKSLDFLTYSWTDDKITRKERLDIASMFSDQSMSKFTYFRYSQLPNQQQALIYDRKSKEIYLWNQLTNRVVTFIEHSAKCPIDIQFLGDKIFMIAVAFGASSTNSRNFYQIFML